MTPKEKASELLDKFTFASIYFTNNTEGAKLNAKTCALITVDEILNTKTFLISIPLSDLKYWQEVKEEIEKI